MGEIWKKSNIVVVWECRWIWWCVNVDGFGVVGILVKE